MGNFQSIAQPEGKVWETVKDEAHRRALESVDFDQWCREKADEYGFPKPCVNFHTTSTYPYSVENCFILETLGTRRRARQLRRELNRFSADMETLDNGRHFVHIRDHMTGSMTVVPLVNTGNNLPELDYMIDPWLEVIAYHRELVVITVREKTKYTPKAVLFCDNVEAKDVGHFPIHVNPNNLNGALVHCCISSDAGTFVLGILEDHYDEFQMHFHALQFEKAMPRILCSVRFDQAVWYEPGLQMAFLNNSCASRVVVLGEYPAGLTIADPTRVLIVYDINDRKVVQCRALADDLYPVCLTSSPDGCLIATLSRNPSAWDGNIGGYVVKVYAADSLALALEIPVSFTLDAFYLHSNCNKIVFSKNSQLLAVTSSRMNTTGVNTYVADMAGRYDLMSKAYVSTYRLPAVDLTLRGMCRDTILDNCQYKEIRQLPLPIPLKEFLLYQEYR